MTIAVLRPQRSSFWRRHGGGVEGVLAVNRISTKLFLALAAMSLLAAAANVIAARASFTTGFLGYLNDQALEVIDALEPDFAAAYARHGSWNFVTEDNRVWFRLLEPGLFSAAPVAAHPKRPPMAVMTGMTLRMALLDTSFHRLAGAPEATAATPRRPIKVDGRVVGWLAVMPFESVSGTADLRFLHQQYTAIWIISSGSIVLGALAAMLLARSLTRPLQRIAHALHDLSVGRYSERLAFQSNDEIGRLAGDFNELARTLEQHRIMRRTFMADISHELRTPLMVLRGLVEAIQDGVRHASQATLSLLASEIATMNKLVNDLYELSLSEIGALAYRKSDVDVSEVLRRTLDAFRERIAARGLLIKAIIPPHSAMIEADEARLQQLFHNVLENAVRYTDPGGAVHVRLGGDERGLSIDFEDSAPAVPDTVLPHIFERLVRADTSRSRATGGTGIGLTICRNIVEAHGGTITAKPAALGGLWIRILLPRPLAQAAA
jgi:two-component system sensor histidine kinase BaeS